MMLWDIIRDFFVQYIFGGRTSIGEGFGGLVGYFYIHDNDNLVGYTTANTEGIAFKSGFYFADEYFNEAYITLGDWLSTTATIIVLCAICVFLFFFVRWLFRLTAGLISGRG